MQILRKSLFLLMVCALVVSCLSALALPTSAETAQTQMWDVESLEDGAAVGTVTATSGHNVISSTVADSKGVLGSKAWAYTVTNSTNNNNYYYAEAAFETAATVSSTDQILWFWVDADCSNVMRLHIEVYTAQYASRIRLRAVEDDVLYTIVADADGNPAIQTVEYEFSDTDGVDGLSFLHYTSAANNTNIFARPTFTGGWSGWVGIPIENFYETNTSGSVIGRVNANDTIEKIKITAYRASGEGTVYTGDALYLDEFWLTDAGTMPALSNAALLYDGDCSGSRALWDFESVEIPKTAASDNEKRNDAEFERVEQYGYNGSHALAYRQTELVSLLGTLSNYEAGDGDTTFAYNQQYMTDTVQFATATVLQNYGFNTNELIYNENDIIWFWAHNDMSLDMRLEIQFNGMIVKGTADVTDASTVYIYTIDETGSPVKISLQAYDAQINGVGLVNNGAGGSYAQLKLEEDWSGWIGIPLNMLHNSSTNDDTKFSAGDRITKISLLMRMVNGTDGYINDQVGDEAIYLDEFWLTEADSVPAVSSLTLAPTVKLKLAERYQSDMIFQRDRAWMLHGTAPAGETVTVNLLNSEAAAVQTKTATVASDNTWSVTMDAMAGAYDAYTIEVTCNGITKTLTNVVFGEVWVAGGQSNMQYKIFQTYNDMFDSITDVTELQTYLTENSTAAAAIRMFSTYTALGDTEEHTDTTGSWRTAEDWGAVQLTTALGMHYAKMLQAELDMPVGIVSTNRGGTSIATWVSPEVTGLAKNEAFKSELEALGRFTTTTLQNRAYSFYYSTVAPWSGYEVAGMLWYQGENDRSYPDLQRYGYDAMVETFSKTFTMDPNTDDRLDVISVQIAPYVDPSYNSSTKVTTYKDVTLKKNTALNEAMREGVAKAQQSGNVVLVPIYDLASVVADHHPLNKLDVANRLFQVAKETYYGTADKSYSGPKPVALERQDDGTFLLTFDQPLQYIQLTQEKNERSFPPYDNFPNYEALAITDMLGNLYSTDGFALYQNKLDGFSVWNGKTYTTVAAEISANNNRQVIITPPEGVCSGELTYAYGAHTLTANLYDEDGLPALPFSLDMGYRTLIWNGEDADLHDGTVLKDVPYLKEGLTDRTYIAASITGDIGLGGSKALTVTYLDTKETNTYDIMISGETLVDLGFTEALIQNNGDYSDILWFWVDSDLPVNRLLHVQINETRNLYDGGIFTIVNDNGTPTIQEIAYDATGYIAGDTLGLVKYNATTAARAGAISPENRGEYARVRIPANWCGWVGVPMSNLLTVEGEVAEGAIQKVQLRLYGPTNEILKGEQVFFDEFWLTAYGEMPPLSAEELTYNTEHQTQLWGMDESNEALTTEFILDNALRNQGAVTRVTSDGVLDSNALKYAITSLVKAEGDNRRDLVETLKLIDNTSTSDNELSANGFKTGVEVQAKTDILWFWIDSDTYLNMRVQPGINNMYIRGGFEESTVSDMSVNENIYIYTIVEEKGVPTMKRIYHTACGSVVDGIGLVNSSRSNKGQVSQLKFTKGWSGWVGIPLNMLETAESEESTTTETIEVGDVIREITLQMRIFHGVDGNMNNLRTDDCMYIDEFWLTTIWMMPEPVIEGYTIEKAQLYRDFEPNLEGDYLLSPETAYSYIDLINADAGSLMEKSYFEYSASNGQPKSYFEFGVAKGKGYLGGNAFALGLTEANTNGNYSNWAHLNITEEAVQELGILGLAETVSVEDMLWFWVDGTELTNDARLTIYVNSLKAQYDNRYYTIASGTNGYYVVNQTMANFDDGGNPSSNGSIPVAQGFQGWIGIPIADYIACVDGVYSAESLDIEKLSFHLKRGTSDITIPNSTVYISDFYIGHPYSETADDVTYSTWEIPPMAELKFSSASLVLQNGISVKFKAKPGLFVDESVEDTIFYHDPYAIFTLHDVVNVIPGVYNAETGMYEFTYYNIQPDWMGDDINAYLYGYRDGTLYRSAEVKLYSVEDYCYNMLNRYYGDAAADGNDALGDLLVDVLKYGGAAQSYTGHNTGALVTAGLSGTAWENWGNQQTLNLTSHQQITAAVETPAAAWKGAALFLRETTRIRLNFTTDLTDALTVVVKTVDGTQSWEITDAQIVKSGTSRFVFFDGLYATQMHQPVTFQVYSGDTPVSNILTYSVETYARSAINGSNALLKNMMTALIRYGDSAIAYVNSVS